VPAEPHQQHGHDPLAPDVREQPLDALAAQRRERRIALEHRPVGGGQRQPLRPLAAAGDLAVQLDPALEPALEPLGRDVVALGPVHATDASGPYIDRDGRSGW
jgi:hypothetical protein